MARSTCLFPLTAIAALIVVPMHTNLKGHAHFASSLRRLRDESMLTITSAYGRSLLLENSSNESASSLNTSATSNVSRSLLPPPMLATDIADEVHDLHIHATNDKGIKLANLSSVDYGACCGLGHRLVRMANAAWIAKKLNFALHSFWGFCGDDTEIFQHLFGVQSKEALQNVTSINKYIQFHNEIPGFRALDRSGPNKTCLCPQDQIDAHRNFYEDLRNRFRHKAQVDKFVEANFANHTVFGIHIRAGNGEKGDFENKKRGINNTDEWVHQAARRIMEHAQKEKFKDPPLLYIATDTPSLIEKFGAELQGSMPVIEFPQERQGDGQGIFFGERGKRIQMSDYQCIRQWENAVTDMIILSHVDILIAGRMSSFVQAMPMNLVFGRKHQKVATSNCELNLNASEMICSKTYLEWCCEINGRSINPNYAGESGKVPNDMDMTLYVAEDRPPFKETPRTNLPYYWKTRAYEENKATA